MMTRFTVPAMALALSAALAGAQQPPAAYAARETEVSARRQAFQSGIERTHAAISAVLRASAPDLLARLDPPSPPSPEGYGLLPVILADQTPAASTPMKLTTYTWTYVDTLIARGTAMVDRASIATERASASGSRAAYEQLVTDYRAIVAQRRLIDDHFEHNRFWQPRAAQEKARFERMALLIDSALATGRASPALTPAPVSPRVDYTVDQPSPREWVVTLPLATDIGDTTFLRSFKERVERLWRVVNDSQSYRLALAIERISPESLYCAGRTAACAPPTRGAAIDVPAHVGRFPASRAVLTTGARLIHTAGGKAIVLSPRDVSPRVLAHELGHVFGFDDAYVRGANDAGTDGFRILELVPDQGDVMSAPGAGSVQARHFEHLVRTATVVRLMNEGVNALYQKRDAATAVTLFRRVLEMRPTHYGGTFQLARALDAAGSRAEATIMWRRVLELAESVGDAETARIARQRLQ